LNILLINAVDPFVEVETRYPNLGLAYLVSALRNHFGASKINCKIIDRDFDLAISSFKPDVVCLTSVTQNYCIAARIAEQAAKQGIPVITGGVHISSHPQSLTKDMLAGCLGEGERIIVDIISILFSKGSLTASELSLVKGIAFWDGVSLVINPPQEQIRNCDEIALPARDLLSIGKHSYMFTSRGCPYRCIFCSSTVFWKKARFFSADFVVREISELVNSYGVKLISFFDDLFIADFERLKKIVDLLEKGDILKKVAFTCSGRANLINDEIAGLLKRMNMRSVGMGLESGCEKTLEYLKGGNVSVEDNGRAVGILRKHGIAANASFVIGSPQESVQDMMETYTFIRKYPLSLFDTYVLVPYPGTALWNYAKAKGLVSDTMNWRKLDVNFYRNKEQAIILSEVVDRQTIVTIYKKFQRLRLFINAKNVWFTPQAGDLLGFLLKTILEKTLRILKRFSVKKYF